MADATGILDNVLSPLQLATGIYSSYMANKANMAAQLAANRITSQTTDKALATQWNLFQTSRSDMSPYRQQGLSALKELMRLTYGNEYGQADLDKAITASNTANSNMTTPWGDKSYYGLTAEEAKLLGLNEGDFGSMSQVMDLFGVGGSKKEATLGAEEFSNLVWNDLMPKLKDGTITKDQATTMLRTMLGQYEQRMKDAGVDPGVIAQSIRTQPTFNDAMEMLGAFKYDSGGKYIKGQAGYWTLGMADSKNGGKEWSVGEQRTQASNGAQILSDKIWGAGGVYEDFKNGKLTSTEFNSWVDKLWGQYKTWVSKNIPDDATRNGTLSSQYKYLYDGIPSILQKDNVQFDENGYVVGKHDYTAFPVVGDKRPGANTTGGTGGNNTAGSNTGGSTSGTPPVDTTGRNTTRGMVSGAGATAWDVNQPGNQLPAGAVGTNSQGQPVDKFGNVVSAGGTLGIAGGSNVRTGGGAPPPTGGDVWGGTNTGKVSPQQYFTGLNQLINTPYGPMSIRGAMTAGFFADYNNGDPIDANGVKLSEKSATGMSKLSPSQFSAIPYSQYDEILKNYSPGGDGLNFDTSDRAGFVNQYFAANGITKATQDRQSGVDYEGALNPPAYDPNQQYTGQTPPPTGGGVQNLDANGNPRSTWDNRTGNVSTPAPYNPRDFQGSFNRGSYSDVAYVDSNPDYKPNTTGRDTWDPNNGGANTGAGQGTGSGQTTRLENPGYETTPTTDSSKPNFQTSALYDWQLKQGERQLRRTMGAKGRTNSTYALNTSRDFYQSLNAQEADKYYNRVAALAGSGQSAAAGTSATAAQTGGQLSNTIMQGGLTQAANQPSNANFWSGLSGATGQALSTWMKANAA